MTEKRVSYETGMTYLEKFVFEAAIANEQIEVAEARVKEAQAAIEKAVDEYVKASFATELDIIEHESLILKEAKQRFDEQKNLAKMEAIEIFETTGEKTPNPVVQVKEYKPELEVDQVEAVKWAVEKNLPTLLRLDSKAYRQQLELSIFEDQPGQLISVVKPSFYTSRLQKEYERLTEEYFGEKDTVFSPLDQIAYVPQHARGSHLDHPDIEYGFVTSVSEDGVFCRFWGGEPGEYMRTKSCSELCDPENLVHQVSTDQAEVRKAWEEIQTGVAEFVEEMKNL